MVVIVLEKVEVNECATIDERKSSYCREADK